MAGVCEETAADSDLGSGPVRPPSGSKLPKANAYAVMTHWRSSFEKRRTRCAEGGAVLTKVLSSTTITCATPTTATISHRRE